MQEHKKRFELAGMVTVGPKGQVVIPADVREKIGIAPGDKLVALTMGEKNMVAFMTQEQMQQLIDHMNANVEELRSVLDK